MNTMSISASIRVPRVSASLAPNQYTSVRQDAANANCIAPTEFDENGREVDLYTKNTFSEMCPSSPLYRINVENAMRPDYAIYLNADGIQGPIDRDDLSIQTEKDRRFATTSGSYDTRSVPRELSRGRGFDYNYSFQLPVQSDDDPAGNMRILQQSMRKRYEANTYKAHSGM